MYFAVLSITIIYSAGKVTAKIFSKKFKKPIDIVGIVGYYIANEKPTETVGNGD